MMSSCFGGRLIAALLAAQTVVAIQWEEQPLAGQLDIQDPPETATEHVEMALSKTSTAGQADGLSNSIVARKGNMRGFVRSNSDTTDSHAQMSQKADIPAEMFLFLPDVEKNSHGIVDANDIEHGNGRDNNVFPDTGRDNEANKRSSDEHEYTAAGKGPTHTGIVHTDRGNEHAGDESMGANGFLEVGGRGVNMYDSVVCPDGFPINPQPNAKKTVEHVWKKIDEWNEKSELAMLSIAFDNDYYPIGGPWEIFKDRFSSDLEKAINAAHEGHTVEVRVFRASRCCFCVDPDFERCNPWISYFDARRIKVPGPSVVSVVQTCRSDPSTGNKEPVGFIVPPESNWSVSQLKEDFQADSDSMVDCDYKINIQPPPRKP